MRPLGVWLAQDRSLLGGPPSNPPTAWGSGSNSHREPQPRLMEQLGRSLDGRGGGEPTLAARRRG